LVSSRDLRGRLDPRTRSTNREAPVEADRPPFIGAVLSRLFRRRDPEHKDLSARSKASLACDPRERRGPRWIGALVIVVRIVVVWIVVVRVAHRCRCRTGPARMTGRSSHLASRMRSRLRRARAGGTNTYAHISAVSARCADVRAEKCPPASIPIVTNSLDSAEKTACSVDGSALQRHHGPSSEAFCPSDRRPTHSTEDSWSNAGPPARGAVFGSSSR
jgi:hypothetical protein